MLTYQSRNLENIAKLGDHTKAAALKCHDYLVANNIDILIYETIRSAEQQRANLNKGASQTMQSYHLVGQALDFVPIVNGQTEWNGYDRPNIKQAIAEAKRLGFEWGGDWKDFIDKPHLQFNYRGYGTDTFRKGPQNGWAYIDGYWYLYENGFAKTGWVKYNNNWYYLQADGRMLTGWLDYGGKKYLLKFPSGEMAVGWVPQGERWFYFDESGAMFDGGTDGWLEVNNKWYFFYRTGEMAANTQIGPWKIGPDGVWIQ